MPEPKPDAQPRVRGNDWPSLRPATLGRWQPTRTVSVVIPAHQAARTLDHTLAALAVQSYPAELMEVVVVDDGSDPALVLPELRPGSTRLVRTSETWGRAHACHVGALAATGDVVHWLDADMLPRPDEVEAQMRWHHLIDYAVVLGHKTFVDLADGLPDLAEALPLLQAGRADELFSQRWTSPHEWVEEHLARTDQLVANPTMSFLVHVGATASVGRALYLAAGGMDHSLRLGEDVELGFRLAGQGAVFVPDAEARSWHLGRSTLMDRQEAVNRYNRPFITDRVPNLRRWRTKGRSYTVPWVQAVVDATQHGYEQVRHTVNALLTGSSADTRVLIGGPWSRLSEERRSPLADPDRDLRLIRAEFGGESRVRFVEELPESAFPATYALHLPAGWAPGRDTVRRLGMEMARRDLGLVSLLLPDGQVARLERTSAFLRAARLVAHGGRSGADLDPVVDEVAGTWWYDAAEEGFTHVDEPAEPAPARRAAHQGAARRESLGSAADPVESTTPTLADTAADLSRAAARRARGVLRRARDRVRGDG